jgi:hypothetical protein
LGKLGVGTPWNKRVGNRVGPKKMNWRVSLVFGRFRMIRNRERKIKYLLLFNVIQLSDYFAEVGRGTKYQ